MRIPSRIQRPWIPPLLLGLLALPGLVFIVIELLTLGNTQDLLQQAWQRQQEGILFSVNQQAWDVSNATAVKVDLALDRASAESNLALPSFSPFHTVWVVDSALASTEVLASDLRHLSLAERDSLHDLLHDRAPELSRLRRWVRSGYRKFEAATYTIAGRNLLCLAYALPGRNPRRAFALLVGDPADFLAQSLGPRLQELSQSGIAAVVEDLNSGTPVYRTRAFTDTAALRRPLTFLPRYALAFSVEGEAPERIAQSLVVRNIIILGIVTVLLIVAGAFLMSNIRRELHLAQLQSDFTANVSHELRTPLALIRMYGETLSLGRVESEERRQEYYRIIVSESERLSRLINRILNFSRMDAGRRPYSLVATDILELTRDTISQFAPGGVKEGHRMDAQLPENPILVNADPDALGEALYNLLDNAVKYSPGKERVLLTIEADGTEVRIHIRDSGLGIEPRHHQRIFEKFTRVSHALVHDTKGSGLGLSIVQHIVHAHGGRVTLVSALGQGSTFTMHLPRIEAEEKHPISTE